MKTRQLCLIALMATILTVSFMAFSSIIYLEVITLVLVALTLTSKPEEAIYASVVFSICIVLNTGFNTFSIMYLIVYFLYTIITIKLKPILLRKRTFAYFYVGILSFFTGQLLDLSFIVFSSKITIFYIIMGLKTSLIQGIISFISAMFLLDPLLKTLERLFNNYEIK